MEIPSTEPVCIDYETVELMPDGSTAASPDYWKPNFRVLSCAFSWQSEAGIQSLYKVGEKAVGEVVMYLSNRGNPIVVHNLAFEEGVTRCRYPDAKLNWHADTMRLAQVYDNGGRDDQFEWVVDESVILEPGDEPPRKRYPLSGLGLVKCARRILGDIDDHKKEAHDWIYANVPEARKGKAGQHLDKLPYELLERYTVADAITTLRLYEFCVTQFSILEYDWTFDHRLYMSTTTHVVSAKIRGIAVNRQPLINYQSLVDGEIATIGDTFRQRFEKDIVDIEFQKKVDYILDVKTRVGQAKRLRKVMEDTDPKVRKIVNFNVGSNKQLAELFVQRLGIQPKFFTDKGSPSFKSAMLSQWGEGGELLKTRRKRMLVYKQSTSLLGLSADDGRWHLGLRVAATGTGRLAGGG